MNILGYFQLALALLFASCSGYVIDGAKPAALKDVHMVSIEMFKNDTLHPRAQMLATSAVADEIARDGTYQIGDIQNADAILEGTIKEIKYSQVRAQRYDTLRPLELQNDIFIDWVLRDASNPLRVLASGTANGYSRLFVDSNLQTTKNNALSDALERTAKNLVSRIANGY